MSAHTSLSIHFEGATQLAQILAAQILALTWTAYSHMLGGSMHKGFKVKMDYLVLYVKFLLINMNHINFFKKVNIHKKN